MRAAPIPSPAATVLRELFDRAHRQLEDSIAGLTEEQLHQVVAPGAHPIAAQYVHVVTGEDWVIQRVLQSRPLLAFAAWTDRTGISELPELTTDWEEWAGRVRVEPQAVRAYAAAVYRATDDFLETMTDEQLLKPVDLTAYFGPAGRNASYALGEVLLHIATHAGEISCLKGML